MTLIKGYAYFFEKETTRYVLKKVLAALIKKGSRYTLRKAINRIYFLIMSNFLFIKKQKYFTFDNKRIPYFYGKIEAFNERTIEIPLMVYLLRKYRRKKILEVGNVMSKYKKYNSNIVDKYEKANGAINEDIVEYAPKCKYDIVFSIFTLEHVGWDEAPHETKKVLRAIKHIITICLSKKGKLIFTAPIGHNKYLDYLIKHNQLKLTEQYFYKRLSLNNRWVETTKQDALTKKYDFPYDCANAILIGIIKK